MRSLAGLLLLLGLTVTAHTAGPAASEIASELRSVQLDPERCYLVRDIHLAREDIRIYFTEGHLIFGKPVRGRNLLALFVADTDNGDAEILIFPPTRSERFSMATFTGMPNLSEHFTAALMLFTDTTAEELTAALNESSRGRLRPERGLLLATRWDGVVKNLINSFSVRLVQELLDSQDPRDGFFFATLTGRRLGNFDLAYDPKMPVQIVAGQFKDRDGKAVFDVWTHFSARSFRNGSRATPAPEMKLEDFRIDARMSDDLAMEVTTRCRMTPLGSRSRAFGFDLSGSMQVLEAHIAGRPAEVFQPETLRENMLRFSENQRFLVIAPEPLEAGASYEVELLARGRVVQPAGNGVYFVSSRASWYPNRDFQFTRYEISFQYPASLRLVASGVLTEETELAGRRTGKWISEAPIRLAGFNVGDYVSAKQERDGLTVEVYANRQPEPALTQPVTRTLILPQLPIRGRPNQPVAVVTLTIPPRPDPAARISQLASEVAGAYARLRDFLGPPPLSRLIVSPIPGHFGQGFPGLLYLSTRSYLPPENTPSPSARELERQVFFSQLLQAHEVAHQWWGNLVTAASYQDDWLLEALANYCAFMLLEEQRGTEILNLMLASARERLLQPAADGRPLESTGPIHWGSRLESSIAPNAWSTITYDKGSWILHMLRVRLGDNNFRKFLAELCRRYRFRPVSTQEFRQLAARFVPPGSPDPELEDFFDHWVEGTGIPTLRLESKVRGKPPALTLEIVLTQSGIDPNTPLLVPVEIQHASGERQVRWIQTGDGPARVSVPVRQPPTAVQVVPWSVLAVVR